MNRIPTLPRDNVEWECRETRFFLREFKFPTMRNTFKSHYEYQAAAVALKGAKPIKLRNRFCDSIGAEVGH
jgi:hypothetical protein